MPENEKTKIKNYTTKVSVIKTLSEIEELLVKHKAVRIVKDYNGVNEVISITFGVIIQGELIAFKLHFDWQKVAEILSQQFKTHQKKTECRNDRKKANQIGWRVIKDWLSSQMSLVEIGLAEIQQILLPYACRPNGQTYYEYILEDPTGKLLLASNGEGLP